MGCGLFENKSGEFNSFGVVLAAERAVQRRWIRGDAGGAFGAQASLSVTADFSLLGMFRNGTIRRPFRPISIYREGLRGQQ